MITNHCVACGNENKEILENHHLLPKSQGGTNEPSNLITLCSPCHGKIHGHLRRTSSTLTKAALAAAKARGVKLGNPQNMSLEAAEKGRAMGRDAKDKKMAEAKARVLPIVERLRLNGFETAYSIAKELNRLGVPTPTGNGRLWYPNTVPMERV